MAKIKEELPAIDPAELKKHPRPVGKMTAEEAEVLTGGEMVKVVLGWLDEPDANPTPGHAGAPIPVSVNGNQHYYPPGVPVLITPLEEEILRQSKRFSVSRED